MKKNRKNCKICNKVLSRSAQNSKNGLCRKCWYASRRTGKNFPHCLDCDITLKSYKSTRCHSCAHKNKITKKCLNCDCDFEGRGRSKFCLECKSIIADLQVHKEYCIDCGKQLGRPNAKRCQSCFHIYGKTIGMNKGKNNGSFGKIYQPRPRIIYKDISMRSSWEVAYAKYLDFNNIKWLYESKTFDLGDTTYTPDFYLPETNEYIEIKGWWSDKFDSKIKKFKKLYDNINLIIYEKGALNFLGILDESYLLSPSVIPI